MHETPLVILTCQCFVLQCNMTSSPSKVSFSSSALCWLHCCETRSPLAQWDKNTGKFPWDWNHFLLLSRLKNAVTVIGKLHPSQVWVGRLLKHGADKQERASPPVSRRNTNALGNKTVDIFIYNAENLLYKKWPVLFQILTDMFYNCKNYLITCDLKFCWTFETFCSFLCPESSLRRSFFFILQRVSCFGLCIRHRRWG